jgi:hypothetical protein
MTAARSISAVRSNQHQSSHDGCAPMSARHLPELLVRECATDVPDHHRGRQLLAEARPTPERMAIGQSRFGAFCRSEWVLKTRPLYVGRRPGCDGLMGCIAFSYEVRPPWNLKISISRRSYVGSNIHVGMESFVLHYQPDQGRSAESHQYLLTDLVSLLTPCCRTSGTKGN